jgi:hypothetical protein
VYGGNNPIIGTDPDGEFFLTAAIIGGLGNWAFNGFQLNAEGLGYFAVGAAAGALSAGVGAGMTNMIAGKAFSAGFMGGTNLVPVGFNAGFTVGASAGVSSGFSTGFGNSLVQGKNFGKSLKSGARGAFSGGLSGGLIGGAFGAHNAHKWDRNLLTGSEAPNEYLAPTSVDEYILPKMSPMTLEVPEVVSLDNRPFGGFIAEHTGPEIVIYGKRYSDGRITFQVHHP